MAEPRDGSTLRSQPPWGKGQRDGRWKATCATQRDRLRHTHSNPGYASRQKPSLAGGLPTGRSHTPGCGDFGTQEMGRMRFYNDKAPQICSFPHLVQIEGCPGSINKYSGEQDPPFSQSMCCWRRVYSPGAMSVETPGNKVTGGQRPGLSLLLLNWVLMSS